MSVQCLTGIAKTESAKAWPWIIERDNQTVVLVETDGGKKPMSVAEVAFVAAQKHGITSLNLVERNMSHKTEAMVCGAGFKGCVCS